MMTATIGSLCTGYGGLDMAVEAFTGGTTIWTADVDKHASKVIDSRMPHAPNLGDVKKIDWTTVPKVDWLTAGYPCQPFSHAGKRLGEEDERHIWPYIREAVRIIEPRFCFFENVAGHRSLGFDSVLRDLAEVGYDCRWGCVRAADAGAPHGRLRIFILAYPHGVDDDRAGFLGSGGGLNLQTAVSELDVEGVTLLPTPDASAHKYRLGGGQPAEQQPGGSSQTRRTQLLPTPTARDHKDGLTARHGRTGAADLLPRAIGELLDEQQ
jgi:DNA (cytosine-5)-methyltransferase 1